MKPLMEPSGRNPWQPVANGAAAKVAQIGENRCWVATGCRVKPMVRRVSGSRPEEGFASCLGLREVRRHYLASSGSPWVHR